MTQRTAAFLYILLVFVLLFSVPRTVAAQSKEEEKIHIDHADSLVGLEINGEKARMLIGHVRFSQGRTIVTCRKATQFLATNIVMLEGEVEMRDDSVRMVGERGVYDANKKVAEAFERVLLQDSTTTLKARYAKYTVDSREAYFSDHVIVEDTSSVTTAEQLTYDRRNQTTVAIGNVVIVNSANNLTIRGNHFENYRQTGYSRMTNHPSVTQIDTGSAEKKDTLTITAHLLESYRDSIPRMIATDSVEIVRGAMAARAGYSVFFTKTDSIILSQSPVVWYGSDRHDENQVSGDTVTLKLIRRKLETASIRGRAVAVSRADSIYTNRFNQMTGREMILHFNEDHVSRIDVITTATSLYYLFDEGKGGGANRISGDRIVIMFDKGKMDKITTRSGVEGAFYPEKMIRGREAEYNLDGFKWRTDKPLRIRPAQQAPNPLD
jgi:lipopolysaccharide export system protein LptA